MGGDSSKKPPDEKKDEEKKDEEALAAQPKPNGEKKEAIPAEPHETGRTKQAEGFDTVVIKDAPCEQPGQGQVVAKVPNGEVVEILQKQGCNVKIKWKQYEGWAKANNVQMGGLSEAGGGDLRGCSDAAGLADQTVQTDIMQTKENVFSVGAWEFLYPSPQEPTGRWKLFRPSERVQLDRVFKPETSNSADVGPKNSTCCMNVGPKSMESIMTIDRDKSGNDGIGSWKIRATGEIYRIRREKCAKELAEVARTAMKNYPAAPPSDGLKRYSESDSVKEILDRHWVCELCKNQRRKPWAFPASKAECANHCSGRRPAPFPPAPNDSDERPVKLLRASWFLEYASSRAAKTGMRKRQDVEKSLDHKDKAFLKVEEIDCRNAEGWGGLERVINVVSVSYCWITRDHSDPEGKQLQTIALLIEDNRSYSDTFDTLGIFWDFGSVHQKNRTGIEWTMFGQAIEYMGLWYAHAMIVTYLLTGNPAPDIFYEHRGWTHFERACAELIKANNAGGGKGTYRMIVDAGSESSRKLPLSPELFSELLAQRQFTTQADKENVVKLYTGVFMTAIRGIQHFALQKVQLKKDDRYGNGKALAGVVYHCLSVTKMSLNDMAIYDEDMIAISKVLCNCTLLQEMSFQGNHIGDGGAKAINEEIRKWPSLKILDLQDNPVRDTGCEALAEAVGKCDTLEKLSLTRNFGTAGEIALRQAKQKKGEAFNMNLRYAD